MTIRCKSITRPPTPKFIGFVDEETDYDPFEAALRRVKQMKPEIYQIKQTIQEVNNNGCTQHKKERSDFRY